MSADLMATLTNRVGRPIATIDDWKRLAPPKTQDQWEEGRSAMELALAWTRFPGGCSPPADLGALLQGHPAFNEARVVSGTAEAPITFDEFSGPRNADLNLICDSPPGPIVISIEAKSDESYGGTVGAQLRAAQRRIESGKRSNAASRTEALLRRFAPNAQNPQALRYQLLTATAATLRFAKDEKATTALLLIHEFVNGRRSSGVAATSERKVKSNANALNSFVRELSGGAVTSLPAPSIVGPFAITDCAVSFYIGKPTSESLPSRKVRLTRRSVSESNCSPQMHRQL